jgi:site-specific DNA-methyltransferase (cytosine-N4-specific)
MGAIFKTKLGSMLCGDSITVLNNLADKSVNLILTSPPYALQDRKDHALRGTGYANPTPEEYGDWFVRFAPNFYRVLTDDGSLVINIGGSWNKGLPTRSLYHWELLLRLCKEYKFHLAEEVFWFKPNPITTVEWANRRKIRLKDAVEMIWWLSKNPYPKSNTDNVLLEYTEQFKKFLKEDVGRRLNLNKQAYNGSQMHTANLVDRGGRQAHNMLYIATTGSDSEYCQRCQANGRTPHPARFPITVPRFFIAMLTDPGDLVVDPFAGSCTTGYACEQLKRKWLCIDMSKDYLEGGMLRFKDNIQSNQQQLFSSCTPIVDQE